MQQLCVAASRAFACLSATPAWMMQMPMFASDPESLSKAQAALSKAEWTRDTAQAAIAALSVQGSSLQEVAPHFAFI